MTRRRKNEMSLELNQVDEFIDFNAAMRVLKMKRMASMQAPSSGVGGLHEIKKKATLKKAASVSS